MQEKSRTLLISFLVFAASLAVLYFFVLPKNKELVKDEAQIAQLNENINTKKAYQEVIDEQVGALDAAQWAAKEPSIAINFTSSPFYVSKMQYFFKSIATSSGVSLDSLTYSSSVSVKAAAVQQPSGSAVKVSTATSAASGTQASPTGYYAQLTGPVKKTTFNLSVSGTYNNFKNFLTQLEGQTRIATVRNITFGGVSDASGSTIATKSKAKKAANLSFQLVVDTYSY
jgi:Tfp pilus assembly protein PilO